MGKIAGLRLVDDRSEMPREVELKASGRDVWALDSPFGVTFYFTDNHENPAVATEISRET